MESCKHYPMMQSSNIANMVGNLEKSRKLETFSMLEIHEYSFHEINHYGGSNSTNMVFSKNKINSNGGRKGR